MNVSNTFQEFLQNLAIDNKEEISNRYKEITKVLNIKYRNTESKISNSLQVGSYGRFTAIKGISDLDMIYIYRGQNIKDLKIMDNQHYFKKLKKLFNQDIQKQICEEMGKL